MGAFLLVNKGFEAFDTPAALEIMERQCGTKPTLFDCGSSDLWLFTRRLAEKPAFREDNNCAVFVTGTAWLPRHTTGETVELLHTHFSKGNNAVPPLRGHYAIILYSAGKITIFNDSFSLYPVYRSRDGNVAGSSFLALCAGLPTLTLSAITAAENLLTGAITGSETIFEEITKAIHGDTLTGDGMFFVAPAGTGPSYPFRSRKEAIDAQIETLDEYFSGMKAMVSELGADTGITGGYDSRLVLALALRHFPTEQLSVHSHLRKVRGSDYLVAEQLAGVAGLPLKGLPVTDNDDRPAGAFETAMDEGMLFSDGQVRSNLFWFEDFTTARYRIEVLGSKRLGLSGIGGEMYRNTEGISSLPISLRSFIRFDIVGRNGGVKSAGKEVLSAIINNIEEKIINGYNSPRFDKSITLPAAKRYLAEVYNPAGRAIRIACENRISWFICPFADVQPVAAALRGAPFLGKSMDFEAEMISRINLPLAGVNSGYGYPFTQREPLTTMLKRFMFRNLVPGALQPAVYDSLNRNAVTPRWHNLSRRSEWLEGCLRTVENSGIPLSAEKLAERTGTGPLVFAMGHLLRRFAHKIN